jgi:uracil-DNA glycosylase family 4
MTSVGRCVPPQNRLKAQEIANCRPFLEAEIAMLSQIKVVLCLGRVAFDGYRRALREMGHDLARLDFGHGAHYRLGRELPHLLASYHPSLQNTNTGRLTAPMMDDVLARAKELFASPS